MKWIFAVLLLNVSLAFAAEPRYDVDENHDPREEQQYSEKEDKKELDAKVKQEQEEKQKTKVNEDMESEDEMMGPSAD